MSLNAGEGVGFGVLKNVQPVLKTDKMFTCRVKQWDFCSAPKEVKK
jgi:hypothetical protein